MKSTLQSVLETKIPLRFRPDGGFRIMMISDIHGGIGFAAVETQNTLDRMIEAVRPDLVLLGGDICGPGYIHAETTDDVRMVITAVTAPMERRGIPWAHVYGNHDDNYGVPNDVQQPIYESFAHCVSKAGDDDIDGTGNYFLPVCDSTGADIRFGIWGMDSHHSMPEFKKEYGLDETLRFFHQSPAADGDYDGPRMNQIFWYWQTSQMLEEHCGHKVPALLYMHIPTPEHALVTLHRSDCRLSCVQMEQVASGILNNGLVSACIQRGDVKAIFCGHDHENNFAAEYCGIKLGYDGFFSYHASHNPETFGCRVFDVREEHPEQIDTHIVLVRDLK